jgi:hypothetical protein
VGGPGVSVPTFDALFAPLLASQTPQYPQSVYEGLTNGPIFGYGLKCGMVRNATLKIHFGFTQALLQITSYYNYTFTNPVFVIGNVTLYGPVGGDNTGIKAHFPKTMQFTNVHGITATIAEIQVNSLFARCLTHRSHQACLHLGNFSSYALRGARLISSSLLRIYLDTAASEICPYMRVVFDKHFNQSTTCQTRPTWYKTSGRLDLRGSCINPQPAAAPELLF